MIAQAFVPPALPEWDSQRIDQFIADMIVPWYFNFYAPWAECASRIEVTYERLMAHPLSLLHTVRDRAGLEVSDGELSAAVEQAQLQHSRTRFNVGVCGRGSGLSAEAASRVRSYARYYRFLNLAPLGL